MTAAAQPSTSRTTRFALIGAGGYIAHRHMKAIKETGGLLATAFDPNDSVGVMDSYFPDAHFFTEFERFDRHIDKLRRRGEGIDYASICSPNYLHDAHMRFALRSGAHAICEKPIVLNPWNIDALEDLCRETDRTISTILQLRLHPAIIALREKYRDIRSTVEVDIAYITSRGRWYHQSWKGDESKSGGIATNIGVHFFDMLSWIFGKQRASTVYLRTADAASGILELEHARVRWFLSINADHLPDEQKAKGQRTYRSIQIGGDAVEFSEGFTDLHTVSYREILEGRGFPVSASRPAIEMVHSIRHAEPKGLHADSHPFCRRVKT
jgi:UDP-N-acetyl-2-amino-2-deoxyglucuronate dehydrogenase